MLKYRIPQIVTLTPPILVVFLHAWGKQKILIPFGNQDFTAFCFSFKWCHQKSNVFKNLFVIC